MPRKGPIPRREVLPDPIYNSRLAARFINRLMYNGKKGVAEKIFYAAVASLGEKTNEEPLRAFEWARDSGRAMGNAPAMGAATIPTILTTGPRAVTSF